jgi:2,5-furandicarboxylate decarboxylase 1
MGVLILPRHLHAFQRAAEAAGEALPVAVVIGASPGALLASQAVLPIDHDELEVAGALEGRPLPVVKCQTSEVRVPAHAEIVIEGRVLPNVRELEGPFGEFPKYYSPQEKREVIAIDRVTHRRDPIYHTIVPAAMEHLLLGGITREATLLAHLKRSFPNVLDVHLAPGGVCRYHLYVQMKKAREGEPKNVIMGAFGGHYDPSTDRGIGAKWGLDATRPLVYEGLSFTKIRIPGEESVDLARMVVDGSGALDAYLARGGA